MYKLGLLQKYFGHFLNIKSKKLKKILLFIFIDLKKTSSDLKNESTKLIIKNVVSKKEFFISILLFIKYK